MCLWIGLVRIIDVIQLYNSIYKLLFFIIINYVILFLIFVNYKNNINHNKWNSPESCVIPNPGYLFLFRTYWGNVVWEYTTLYFYKNYISLCHPSNSVQDRYYSQMWRWDLKSLVSGLWLFLWMAVDIGTQVKWFQYFCC